MKERVVYWILGILLSFNIVNLSVDAKESTNKIVEEKSLVRTGTSFIKAENEKSTGTYRYFYYTLNEDDTVTLDEYYGSSTTVSVPATINGYPVTEIGKNCFYSTSVRNVTIPIGITKIGESGFGYCEDLTSVSIPSTVTEISMYAFDHCTSLTSVTIPSGVEKIGYSAFYSCSNLQTVTIPSSVTTIQSDAFKDCYKLLSAGQIGSGTNVQIEYTDTLLSCYQYAFTNIESVSLPNSIKHIEDDVFSGCSKLKSITIPSDVITIGKNVFAGCSSLKTVVLPQGLLEIGDSMFNNCSALESLSIPQTVTRIGDDAFSNCSSLKELLIPDSVKQIGDFAFRGCNGISELIIPDNVSVLGSSALSECVNLSSVKLSSGVSVLPQTLFYGSSKLESVTVPEGIQKISTRAFSNCASLKTVSFPSTITYIDQNIFDNSPKIQTIIYNGIKDEWDSITKFHSGISSSIHIKFNDGYNTFDFASLSADAAGDGYEWNYSRKELVLSGFNEIFSANPGILLPMGSKIIFNDENTITSVYSSSDPGDIIRTEDGMGDLRIVPGSTGSLLNITDNGYNNGINSGYGVTGPFENSVSGTVNINSNATGIYFRDEYYRSSVFHSGQMMSFNITAKKGIGYAGHVDVTYTSKSAELNINASDIGIECLILDMGDAAYNIHVSKQNESDSGVGIKAMDIVEQGSNRAGSLYVEADTAAFEYNGDYNTRIILYNSSYAIVEPYHFDQGNSIYYMNLDTGEPAKILSIQPVGLRVFGGDIVSSGEQSQIAADEPSLGYEFDKWVRANGNGTGSVGDISAMFTSAGSSVNDSEAALIPSGKTYILSTYKAINYPIIYDLNFTGSESEPVHVNPKNTYTINDSFELVNPEMEGYVFTGWSGTGLEGENNLNVTISEGTTGELAFTAHWEKVQPKTYAYAILTDNGDLVFFRSENVYQNDTTGSFTDIAENMYEGRIFSSVENVGKNIEESAPWWMYMSSIKQVYVAEGQTISPRGMANWFQFADSLKSFNAAGFDTSNVQNMYHLFYNCNSLSSLDVSGFDTSNVTTMHAAFSHCASLKTLELGEMNTSNVTDMGSMFEVDPQLTSLDLSSFDTSNVKRMEAMFYGDSSLLSLDLHGFNTAEVKFMDTMFTGCTSLNELNTEGFDTKNVTNMGWMFSGCSSLVSLNLSHFDTSAVTEMSSMFRSCESLEELNISSFVIASASYANNIFTDDNSLKTIQIGHGFKMNSSSGLPEGNWKNGSLVKTADQLMENYNSNASEWHGTWNRTILVQNISLDKNSLELKTGETVQLTAVIEPENAGNQSVDWYSANPDIASVDEFGNVTGVSRGKTNIIAKAKDGTDVSAQCTVTVTIPVSGVELSNESITLRRGETAKLTASVIPSNADHQNVVWESSDESVATVDTEGNVTGISNGTAIITVTSEEGEYTARCTVTVENSVEAITLNKTEVTGDIGDIIQLSVTAEPDDSDPFEIVWTSDDETVAGVDETGKVTITGTGTAVITASVTGTGLSAQCTVISSHSYEIPEYTWKETETGYSVTAEAVCGNNAEHTLTETVNAVKEVQKEASCEETGLTVYTAAFDNELFETQTNEETVPALGHNYGEWATVKEATCTEEGEEQRVCLNNPDHIETRNTGKISHKLVKTEAHSSTCEETGNTEYWTCQRCGGYFLDEEGTNQVNENTWIVPALGHEWGEWNVVSEAGCETEGTEQRICMHDERHTEERVIPAIGHNYGEWSVIKEATCEEAGSKQRVCANDEAHVETEVIPATGHNFGNWTVITEPTCEEAGLRRQICANDETHINEEEIPATGHRWGHWIIGKESTCTQEGYEYRICENDSSHSETRTTAKKEHTWGEWHIVTDPTYDEPGESERICEVCGERQTAVIPAISHEHEFEHTEALGPTCTEEGNTEYYHCSICGNYYRDAEGTQKITIEETVIPALGHEWGEWYVLTEAGCETDGTEQRICVNDESHTEERVIPATGHNYGEWSVVKDATCEEDGIKQRVCANDETHTETEAIPATGHNYGNWTVVIEPTCEETGLRRQVCANDETHINEEEIPAIGHKWGDWTLVKEAACEEAGEEIRICENDKTHTETRNTVPLGHQLTLTPEVKATCDTGGNTEYWTCERCGKYYADEAGTEEIGKGSWITEALGHEWDEGRITIKPTYTKEGEITYVCRHDSSHKKTEKIAKLVRIDVQSIKLNKTSLLLEVKKEAVLAATVLPANATDRTVTWTSSNTAVATVSNGKVTAVKAGTATITAKAGNKTATAAVTVKETKTGWIKESDTWYYYDSSGKALTGWQKINNVWYYFNSSGAMLTRWQKINNVWYYFNGSGAMLTGWQKISNVWYYFNSSGAMLTGWQKINNVWYYFNGSGAMLTGWQKISNVWYYFNSSGAMLTGWQKINNVWYYFNSSGAMLTGWQKISNVWYYFNSSGAMLTGWQKISNVWYYFNSSGAMKTGWLKLNDIWYYFESSGAMVTGNRTINGKTYNFDSSGKCLNP